MLETEGLAHRLLRNHPTTRRELERQAQRTAIIEMVRDATLTANLPMDMQSDLIDQLNSLADRDLREVSRLVEDQYFNDKLALLYIYNFLLSLRPG